MSSSSIRPVVTITIPSDPRFLAIIRESVRRISDIVGFQESHAERICLAIDEACANIIRHSYDNVRDRKVLFQCDFSEREVRFRLRDFGKKANPENLKPRDLEDIRPGGLGLHFIREIMDEVKFNTDLAVGTELIMVKRLPSAEGEKAS